MTPYDDGTNNARSKLLLRQMGLALACLAPAKL